MKKHRNTHVYSKLIKEAEIKQSDDGYKKTDSKN